MSIQSINLAVKNRGLTLVQQGSPKNLDEAKSQEAQRVLDESGLKAAQEMLTSFQTLAGQLARIDNQQELTPQPKRPGIVEGFLHPERVDAYKTESARLEEFNGRDLSDQPGHVLTTAKNNTVGRDAELTFTPGAKFEPSPTILQDVSLMRVEYAGHAFDDDDYSTIDTKERWNFSAQEGKLVFEHQTEIPESTSIRTLTVDPVTGQAIYSTTNR